jgi:uracil phosphoribosyltransferase
MHIYIISEQESLLNHFLAEIRDINIQKDRMRFRRNIERIGEIMSYEISKKLAFQSIDVQTPLGIKKTSVVKDPIVLCSILRAGLTLHQGFLNYFDTAENGYISAYRHHPTNDDFFEIVVQYQAVPSIENKTVLLIDPMLATGQSIEAVLKKLLLHQTPKEIHIAVAIATPEGIDYLKKHLPANYHLWIGALDDGLNEQKYIIPGLGDAGDLAFGEKL